MKIHIAALALAVSLTGCANYEARQAAQQKDALIASYMSEKGALVKGGQMKKSAFYAGLYDVAQTPPVRPVDLAAAQHANEMIPIAKQLEDGTITQDQYDQKLRDVQLDFAKDRQGIAERQAEQDQARRAIALQYYLQTRPVTTTCFGNSCTTR